MSRSLVGFLLFCLLLAGATAGVVWYVGPALAAIVVDREQRENPYYLLQLLPTSATTAGAEGPSYRSRFVNLAANDDARLLWQGGGVEVTEGSILLDVTGVQLMQFPTGVDLVQMLTSTGYRALATSTSAEVRHLGTSRAPERLAPDAATVVVLYRADDDGSQTPLGAPGEQGWLALLPQFRGEVRWNAPVTTVRGAGDWNRVMLIQFPGVASAQQWLEEPRTATERAIARRQVDHMVVLVVQPSEFAAR